MPQGVARVYFIKEGSRPRQRVQRATAEWTAYSRNSLVHLEREFELADNVKR